MSSKMTVQPALHNGWIQINDVMAKCGTICPVRMVGRPGITMLHLCADCTVLPSGRLMVRGFF